MKHASRTTRGVVVIAGRSVLAGGYSENCPSQILRFVDCVPVWFVLAVPGDDEGAVSWRNRLLRPEMSGVAFVEKSKGCAPVE